MWKVVELKLIQKSPKVKAEKAAKDKVIKVQCTKWKIITSKYFYLLIYGFFYAKKLNKIEWKTLYTCIIIMKIRLYHPLLFFPVYNKKNWTIQCLWSIQVSMVTSQ